MRRAFWLMLLAACGHPSHALAPGGGKGSAGGQGSAASGAGAIDRFSAAAGHIFVRGAGSSLPAAGAAIDFDQAPFITQALGPAGEVVRYYHFDLQPATPATVYSLTRDGAPVPDQLPIIDALPGQAGYSDFHRVVEVAVSAGYRANTVTAAADLAPLGLTATPTDRIENCPIVPPGSTARLRAGGGVAEGRQEWFRGQRVTCLPFETALTATAEGATPTSPIYVAFKLNPDRKGGGPPSGFRSEAGGVQTHNVVASLPGDTDYSPLWLVNVWNEAAFDRVHDLTSAEAAPRLASGVATVNCPLVYVQPR